MYSFYSQRQFVSPSVANNIDPFLSNTIDPSYVMSDFSTHLFQTMDDCSIPYINLSSPFTHNNPTLSHVHPLQIHSSSAHDAFPLFLPTEENVVDFNQQFPPKKSRSVQDSTKEDDIESLSLSPAQEIEDLDSLSDYQDEKGEQDSDWETPRRKKTKSLGPSKFKRSASVSSTEIQCCHCKTNNTPLWRRSPEGKVLCNACGLFLKLHGVIRPLSLKSDVIKRRRRSGSHKRHKSRKQKH